MMSLLVQLFSNEESANILPVPWFALHRCRFHGIGRLVGGLFLPDGLPEAVQLNRSGVSGLSKPAQGGVTTIGTFNYFAGDDPTGPVFLAASRKK
jgi:hypothetical protein